MVRYTHPLRIGLLMLCATLGVLQSKGNNIQVANGVLTGNNGTQMFVQFDLTWENSWRMDPDRWDAAWVFVKYKGPDGLWRHASLDNSGHVAPGGAIIAPGLVDPVSAFNASTNPAVGVFIHRSAEGSGTFTSNGVQLRWNYGVNNIAAIDVQEVRVFAIEMVYVPQGAFAAGSGGTETNAFTLTTINTSNATTAPSGTGSLGGQAGGYPTGQVAPANASWPNGFNAFYCMKYEVTQQGYVDFLNTLTYDQQVTRTATVPTSAAGTGALSSTNDSRNGIDIQTSGMASTAPAVYACNGNGNGSYGEVSDGTDIACNYLDWNDLAAYMDWCGLRPMTEMEYEKACRGYASPLPNEYPWGTTTVISAGAGSPIDISTPSEISSGYSTLGNAHYRPFIGSYMSAPFRVGVFAGNPNNTGRVTSGAGFFGIMELGGNLHERIVSLSGDGMLYTGVHGNGSLANDGAPDVVAWPVLGLNNGIGSRGGSGSNFSDLLRVSDRTMATTSFTDRRSNEGGRGVRSAQ